VFETWIDQLPRRPAATDDFSLGVFRRPREEALQKRHLEFNPFGRVSWLFFDIDRDASLETWMDAKLPAPNVFIQNRDNSRSHLGYALSSPVGTTGLSREKPMKFAADVQYGMTRALDADKAYSNRFAKNPLSPSFRTSWLAIYPYELSELRGWLDDEDVWRPKGAAHAVGLGRNCDLFDVIRVHAYSAIREFKRSGGRLDDWLRHLFEFGIAHNLDFASPLNVAEVGGIARSVARWTWRRLNEEGFRHRQSVLGRKGAEARWEGHQSLDYRRPWEAEGISRATWFRRRGS
jgi:hypothetical protein